MSKRDDTLLTEDILQALKSTSRYTKGMTFDNFFESKITVDALIRNFEICGEASNYLSSEYKEAYPQIQWQKLTDFRNRLIHHYFGINHEIVWDVIENEEPVYINYLESQH